MSNSSEILPLFQNIPINISNIERCILLLRQFIVVINAIVFLGSGINEIFLLLL
jgi:hypothetical protein